MKKMSHKQLSANRENAKLGGVKTVEGKAVSRYNATKHGILRSALQDSETVQAEQMYNDLSGDLQPVGRMQEALVEIIASNMVRAQRVSNAEVETLKSDTSKAELSSTLLTMEYTPTISIEGQSNNLRYGTTIENRIYKALAMLRLLKGNGFV